MSTNGVNGPFNGDFKVRLQNRGPKSSGITWELKNIFEELRKQGKLKDTDEKGLTKQDAINMYETLNKIHQDTHRATNYTKMQVGQEFTYTAEEMTAMAKAAGYEIVGDTIHINDNEDDELTHVEDIDDDNDESVDNLPENTTVDEEVDNDSEDTNPPQTKDRVKESGGKVITRDVDGLKQDVAVYELPESKVKVRRAFNSDGVLGASVVATQTLGNNDYVTLLDDERSNNLGEMELKKVKIDGGAEKEFIVMGKTTDEIGETKYYRFIPKVGHADSDGKNNRLGQEVFKVNGKYVTEKPEETEETEEPKKQNFFTKIFHKKNKQADAAAQTADNTEAATTEKPKKKNFFTKIFHKKSKQADAAAQTADNTETATTEKPKKKNFIQKIFSKKDKKQVEKAPEYDFAADYAATQKVIKETVNSDIETEDALEKVFGIKHSEADKMLKEVSEYIQQNDISTDAGKKGMYNIAAKYNVEAGKLQAFLDSLS